MLKAKEIKWAWLLHDSVTCKFREKWAGRVKTARIPLCVWNPTLMCMCIQLMNFDLYWLGFQTDKASTKIKLWIDHCKKKEKSGHTLWAVHNWSNKVTSSILNKWSCLSQNRINHWWLTHSMWNVLDLTDLKSELICFGKEILWIQQIVNTDNFLSSKKNRYQAAKFVLVEGLFCLFFLFLFGLGC